MKNYSHTSFNDAHHAYFKLVIELDVLIKDLVIPFYSINHSIIYRRNYDAALSCIRDL